MHRGREFLNAQAWGLGGEKVGSFGTFGYRWDKGQGEHHDAQAAQPLHDGAPKQDAVGLLIHVLQDGGAGGGESRDGLEECVGDVADGATQQERQHSEGGEQNPRKRDDHKGVVVVEACPAHPADGIEYGSHPTGDGGGDQKSGIVVLAASYMKKPRHCRRQQQCRSLNE